MRCPNCGEDTLIYGHFSFSEKLRASCEKCNTIWIIDGKSIVIKTMDLKDKTD